MKWIKLLMLPTVLLLFSCNDKQPSTPQDGEIFDLDFRQTQALWNSGMQISFDDVIDERCPPEALCILPTFAEAKLSFKASGNSNTSSLSMFCAGHCYDEDGTCGQIDTVQGYIIQLLYIHPYNGSMEEKEVYSVKLKIEQE